MRCGKVYGSCMVPTVSCMTKAPQQVEYVDPHDENTCATWIAMVFAFTMWSCIIQIAKKTKKSETKTETFDRQREKVAHRRTESDVSMKIQMFYSCWNSFILAKREHKPNCMFWLRCLSIFSWTPKQESRSVMVPPLVKATRWKKQKKESVTLFWHGCRVTSVRCNNKEPTIFSSCFSTENWIFDVLFSIQTSLTWFICYLYWSQHIARRYFCVRRLFSFLLWFGCWFFCCFHFGDIITFSCQF